jgi:sec-independent protein translocase protein TatA
MPIGAPELLIVLAIILVVFGAGKLPQIGNALGRSIREFRESSEGKNAETPAAPDTTPSEQKKSGL